MKVFKFGGASVKNADAVRNVAKVLELFQEDELIIVISAMGKTTNILEEIAENYFKNPSKAASLIEERRLFHMDIMRDLFTTSDLPIFDAIHQEFDQLKERIEDEPSDNYDFEYDQIVSLGEVISTKIVDVFLQQEGRSSKWFDARRLVRTDNDFRQGKVNWEKSERKVQKYLLPYFDGTPRLGITQGFLGHTPEKFTTTLGREGSDFSAAIFAYLTNAESVTIWKDVPGVLNADPKWFDDTEKLDRISFKEAIELSYYGATIIHPKTIKPLQNKQIPLYVKSFVNPENDGTVIQSSREFDMLIPSFIFKMKQVLISITPRDFSFIIEENLSYIFDVFAQQKVKINLMQNSAINFSVCVDDVPSKVDAVVKELQENFKVLYNRNLELVTIRHYDQSTIDRVTVSKEILLEQKTRHTARIIMRDLV